MHDVLLKALGIAEIFPLDTLSAGESVQVVLYDAVTDVSTISCVRHPQSKDPMLPSELGEFHIL